jgi:hypothetical protein
LGLAGVTHDDADVLLLERSVSATTLPVLPEASSATNTCEPPVYATSCRQQERAALTIMCPMDVVHDAHE